MVAESVIVMILIIATAAPLPVSIGIYQALSFLTLFILSNKKMVTVIEKYRMISKPRGETKNDVKE